MTEIIQMRPRDWMYTMRLMRGVVLTEKEAAQTADYYPNCYVVLDDAFRPQGYMGLIPTATRGLAEGWSVFKPSIGPHMIAIHRAIKNFLPTQPFDRVFITVEPDFALGHRWANMLGFKQGKSIEHGGKTLAYYEYHKG